MKNTIRFEREHQNFTQEELATKTGVSRQTIISIESGRFVPSTLLSFKIAKVLQKRVDDLFFLEEYD